MIAEPRRLTRAGERDAIPALADAFAEDPLFVRLFGGIEGGGRARLVGAFLDGVVGMNRWSGGLRWGVDAPGASGASSAGALAAVAIVERPRVRLARVRSGLAMVRFLPVALTLSRPAVRMVNSYGAAVRRAAPRAPHHYLTMIGVRPAYQGQGVASSLLAAVVDAADADPVSTGVALDTENEENVALYEHKGFVMTCRQVVDGMPVYSMFRPSGKARG